MKAQCHADIALCCPCAQVSLRSSARPGRAGGNLKTADFKHSRTLYYVTSREAPNIVWVEKFLPSAPEVKAYQARDKSEYPDQQYLDHGDTYSRRVRKSPVLSGTEFPVCQQ